MPGYSINWKANNKNKIKNTEYIYLSKDADTDIVIDENNSYPTTASSNLDHNAIIVTQKNLKAEDSCDIIELKDKTTIRAKVKEISNEQIKYQKCNDGNDSELSINKSDIESITYSNGQKEVFESPETSEQKNNATISKKKKKEKLNTKKLLLQILLVGLLALIFLPLGAVFLNLAWTSSAGVLLYLIAGIVFAALGAACVAIGLTKSMTTLHNIKHYPEDKKYKPLAILAVILNGICVIAIIAIALFLLLLLFVILLFGI